MKNKKMIIIIVCAIIGIAGVGLIFSNFSKNSNPKKLVKEYIDAKVHDDYVKLYELGMYDKIKGDKTFLTKELAAEMFKNQSSLDELSNDYTISEGTYGVNNQSVNFKVKGVSDYQYTDVTLNKASTDIYNVGKSTWSIEELEYYVVPSYRICVPKDVKVKFQGIEVTDKYIKDKNDKECVYELPYVFASNATIEYDYYGMKTTKEVNTTSKDEEEGYNLTLDDSENLRTELTNQISADMGTILNGINNKLEWEEVKKNFDASVVSEDLGTSYNEFKDWVIGTAEDKSFTNDNLFFEENKEWDYTNYKVEEVGLSQAYLNTDLNFYVNTGIKIGYEYTAVTYDTASGNIINRGAPGTEMEREKVNTDIDEGLEFIYTYKNNKFELVTINGLMNSKSKEVNEKEYTPELK